METNQYHLPPTPLADIGDQVSRHVEEVIEHAIENINAEIEKHAACLSASNKHLKNCGSDEAERKRLDYLLSNDAVAYENYKSLGSGTLVTTKIGHWLNAHNFGDETARYKTRYLESIYAIEPINYITLSPTVNFYGVFLGTDKLEHLFQQGFRYYRIYEEAIAKGNTRDAAAQKAVHWGQFTERTYFGLLVSGVFSNADLAANYVGMKFYQGLTEPLTIGNAIRPAILVQQNARWEFNPFADIQRDLLQPLISQHLNEALNPSIYAFTIYNAVHQSVKTRACSQWAHTFPNLSKAAADSTTRSLNHWNGEDYGHQNGRRMVTIGGTCFSNG
jgi:hypothetical protein